MLDPKVLSGVQWPRKSQCSECKKHFTPSPRLKLRQNTCGERNCLLAHRARYRRKYRLVNADSEKEYQEKSKANRPAGFWKNYREKNLKSTQQNRLNVNLRQGLKRAGLQRQLDIVEVIDSPEYFESFCAFAMSHRSLLENLSATHAL